MAGSVQQFWQMVVRSGLHDEAACREFANAYFQAKESGKIAGQSLPEWLVASKALTRYQAKILIAGRPGPFVFDEYVVNEKIEAGSQAGQFRATHRGTGCPVTLRFLSGPPAADAALLASFAEQASVMAALSRDTTRLAHCYALVDTGAYKFFVLEALAGESLADRLSKPTVVAPADAVRVVAQVATGLARLHRAGRAHGEIGPGSIWISPNGAKANGAKSISAKLLGFPWAPDPLGQDDAGAATAANYRPPERTAQTPATPSGDVYSLGCILYQLLARKPAFQPVDLATPLDKVATVVTPQLAGLVARMVAKNPTDRITDAAQLAQELGSIEGGQVAASAPSALRVALDAAVTTQRSQSVSLVAAAHPQLTPVAATPEKSATAPVDILGSSTEAPVVAAAQPAGVASLAGLVDHDEPLSAASSKPRAVVATGVKNKNLPLIAAGASTIVVLIAVALMVLSRGFGGSTAPQTAQVSPPKPTPAVVAETDGGDGPLAPNSTEPDDPAADPEAPVPPSPGPDPSQTAGAETKPPGAPESPATGRPGDPLVGVRGEMWASPTAGKPLDLAYLPPGGEVIVALRAADFARHPEAQRLLDPRTSGALGTWISEQLPALAGAPLDGIDQALIAVLPTPEGAPRLALVAQLKEAPAEDALLKSWGNPQPKESDGVKYFQKGDMAYYVPAAGGSRTIVVAPAALLVEDILPNGVNPPALRREMELLLNSSDADRLVTLLAAPNILLTGGDEWLPGAAARARSPLDWFLAGEAEDRSAPPTLSGKPPRRGPMTDLSSSGLPKGLLASAHLTDADLFLEIRLLADPNQPPKRLADGYQERVARLSRRTSDFLRTLAMSDYSRDVLFEFPLMVEQLAHFTVAGTEGRQVVLRTYLPAQAAHNLALGGHLAMLETPRAGGAAGPTQTAGGPTKAPIGPPTGTTPTGPGGRGPMPKEPGAGEPAPGGTVAERLDRKISLNFDRNTLEPTLKQIGQEIGVEIVIMGADLQNEGITRNKAINKFEERELPAREILHKIMEKANPDGKLIYVIKPAQSGAGEALYFTTRAAAAARGDKLPAEFEK